MGSQVQEAIAENLDESGQKTLDAVIEAMPDNDFKSVKDMFG